MLGDTTGLSGYHVGTADIVEQRRFTVVNVSHDGNNRGTGLQILFVIISSIVFLSSTSSSTLSVSMLSIMSLTLALAMIMSP
jgi:hypothetical protein